MKKKGKLFDLYGSLYTYSCWNINLCLYVYISLASFNICSAVNGIFSTAYCFTLFSYILVDTIPWYLAIRVNIVGRKFSPLFLKASLLLECPYYTFCCDNYLYLNSLLSLSYIELLIFEILVSGSVVL